MIGKNNKKKRLILVLDAKVLACKNNKTNITAEFVVYEIAEVEVEGGDI